MSITIPITEGHLNLGTWQGIYFCEYRNYGGSRELVGLELCSLACKNDYWRMKSKLAKNDGRWQFVESKASTY